ncbi:MAG: hypothetical protein Q9185_000627 [Variospora sp. 1 TL-2023]
MRPLHGLYLTIAYLVEVPIMDPVLLSWHFGEIRRDAERRHLPLPDEEMAREDCLRPDNAAPDIVMAKDFIRFYIATSTPKLTNKPTLGSINTVAEWFFAGFTRVTGIDTDE